jgi:hypothetical protein
MNHRLLLADHVFFFLADGEHRYVLGDSSYGGRATTTQPEETGGAQIICKCAVGLQVRPFRSARPACRGPGDRLPARR